MLFESDEMLLYEGYLLCFELLRRMLSWPCSLLNVVVNRQEFAVYFFYIVDVFSPLMIFPSLWLPSLVVAASFDESSVLYG